MKVKAAKRVIGILLAGICLFVSYVAMPAKALADELETSRIIKEYESKTDFSRDVQLTYSPLIGEEENKRGESEKHFLRADGAVEAVLYPYPVHMQENGKWRDIDNTLIPFTDEKNKETRYRTVAGADVQFGDSLDADQLVRYTLNDQSVSWRFLRMEGGKAQVLSQESEVLAELAGNERQDMELRFPETLSSAILYENPETGESVRYVLTSYTLSEYITVKERPTEKTVYQLELKCDGVYPVVQEDGSILFENDKQEPVFRIGSPSMEDADGEASEDIRVSLMTAPEFAAWIEAERKAREDRAKANAAAENTDVGKGFAEEENIIGTGNSMVPASPFARTSAWRFPPTLRDNEEDEIPERDGEQAESTDAAELDMQRQAFVAERLNIDPDSADNALEIVPDFYTPEDTDKEMTASLFSFTDGEGAVYYRIYGSYKDTMGFFACDAFGENVEIESVVSEEDDRILWAYGRDNEDSAENQADESAEETLDEESQENSSEDSVEPSLEESENDGSETLPEESSDEPFEAPDTIPEESTEGTDDDAEDASVEEEDRESDNALPEEPEENPAPEENSDFEAEMTTGEEDTEDTVAEESTDETDEESEPSVDEEAVWPSDEELFEADRIAHILEDIPLPDYTPDTADKNTFIYMVEPDMEWLQKAAYPVVIDPEIKPLFSGSAIDAYITASSPTSNYSTRDRIKIGSSKAYDGLVYFDITSLKNQLQAGDVVLEATINLSRYAAENGGYYVTAYPIVKDWITPQAYTWNKFQALGNPVDTSRAIALVGAAYGSNFNHFDVTDLTKKWIAGIQPNYGILLDGSTYIEYRSADYNAAYSGHPYFSLIYVNSTGLEDRYSYYSQQAGRAGTGSVNLFSGNLTWMHADASVSNGVLPVSLSHVYNTNDRTTNIGYGYGWRLNYSQSLKKVELTNRTETATYYQLIDGDGTRQYYKYSSANTYVNELDHNSTLTISGTTVTISDKGGNQLIFACDSGVNNGRLTTVQDANGNQILISYSSTTITDLKITSIQEKLAGQSAGQSITLAYTSNLLSSITVPNGLNVNYTYSSTDLTGISYADGKSSSYTYSNHCLTRAMNVDSYNLTYTYNGTAPYRVTKVEEKANTTAGQYLTFTYGWNCTTVTDKQGRDTIYQFDNNGQAVSLRDNEGNAVYAAYNTADRTVTQLSAVSKLQSTTTNLLKNGHFARSAEWTLGTGASYYGDYGYNGHRTMRLNAAANIAQTVSVTSGKTYTLSASVCGGSGVYLQIVPTSGSTVTSAPASVGVAQGSGWEKLSVSFRSTYTGTVTVKVVNGGSAQAWVDYVQFEQSASPGRYNLVENTDWNNGTNQYYFNGNCDTSPSGIVDVGSDTTPLGTTHPSMLDTHVYKIAGNSYNNYLYCNTRVNGSAGDTWTFGAWCYTNSPACTTQRIANASPYDRSYCNLNIRVRFLDSDYNEISIVKMPFLTDISQWQYVCGSAVAPSAYTYVALQAEFSFACNTSYFDGMQLYREEFSQAYSYDSSGNLTGYTSLIGQHDSFTYDSNNNVTRSTDPKGNQTNYTYDSKHNLLTATSPQGVVTTNTYNAKGQVTETKVGNSSTYIRSSSAYDAASGLTSSVTDARGNSVLYGYDSTTRQNTSITDPKGNVSTYTYGNAANMRRLASLQSADTGTVSYGYDAYGKLTAITRGSTVYGLTYDTWNRSLATKVGNTALSTNAYDSYGRLSSVTYGNGFTAQYIYDELDRVTQIKLNNSLAYEMIYNAEGNLYEQRNYKTHRATFFDYDHAGRCMASLEKSFTGSGSSISYGSIVSSYKYEYDVNNNLTKLANTTAGQSWNTIYTYDGDNRPLTATFASGKVLTNTYDAIGRVTQRRLGLASNYDTVLTYEPGVNSSQTALLATYKNGSDTAYAYEYDANGNITSITQGTVSVTYTYNDANELIRENNGFTNQTVTYAYDDWGNITEKKVYAYTTAADPGTPTQTIPYVYGNNTWGDQLTSYNNQSISYDAMGNPTSYLGSTLTWEGKQLTGVGTTTYAYDENGLRTQKTVSGTTTNYHYNGSVLMSLVQGGNTLLFSYDAQGRAAAVSFNGTYYYYIRNGQGDVIKLIDNSGATVVEYSYDTWGKQLSCTGSLASTLGVLNPFRYRGYVYDEETQWYYLQSRYYNPDVGRFISADILLSTGQGVIGHNTYAYCLNNPVNMGDSSGKFPEWIIVVIVTIIAAVLSTGCSCEETKNTDYPEDFIPCSDRKVKCYGYAMKYVCAQAGIESTYYDDYTIPAKYDFFTREPIDYNVSEVAKNLSRAIKSLVPNAEVSIVNDITGVSSDDLVIATRVTGAALFAIDDYHFAIRLKDGTWADKQGSKAATIGHIISGDEGWGNYHSETKYIVVHINEE